MKGTDFETPVFVNDSGRDGPVAMIVGGMHGIEPAGWMAAAELATAPVDKGKLVVIPQACRPAIEQRQYTPDQFDTDLNGHFPPDDTARSELARQIWGVADRYSPELFVDLHASNGLWKRDGLGMCIFPTEHGIEAARDATEFLTDYTAHDHGSAYNWSVGNVQGEQSEDTLIDRAGWLVAKPGWIIEVPQAGTSLEERIKWHKIATGRLLRGHGVQIGY